MISPLRGDVIKDMYAQLGDEPEDGVYEVVVNRWTYQVEVRNGRIRSPKKLKVFRKPKEQ